MGRHIGFRSGNPALGSETFRGFGTDAWERNMTIQGTVNKTGFALLLLLVTATISWNDPNGLYLIIGFGGGLGLLGAPWGGPQPP